MDIKFILISRKSDVTCHLFVADSGSAGRQAKWQKFTNGNVLQNLILRCCCSWKYKNGIPHSSPMSWALVVSFVGSKNRGVSLHLVRSVNSLWPSDAIWRQGSRSTLAQVMACCCLMAPSHYLNQYWLMISQLLWHSPDKDFTENT